MYRKSRVLSSLDRNQVKNTCILRTGINKLSKACFVSLTRVYNLSEWNVRVKSEHVRKISRY